MTASNGDRPPRPRMLTTVQEVVDWFSGTNLRLYAPTAMRERQRVLGLFCKRYGSWDLETCRPADLLEFIESHRGLKSQYGKRRWASTICRPFNLATRLGMIIRNPFLGLWLPQGEPGRDLTDREFRTLLRHSHPALRRLLIFLRLTGARPGEARSLKWEHINLETLAIVLPQHKTRLTQRLPRPRIIPLNSIVVKLFTWIRRGRAQLACHLDPEKTSWSRNELAKLLLVSPQFAGDLVKRHKLQGLGWGHSRRFPRETVEALLAIRNQAHNPKWRQMHPVYVFANYRGRPWALGALVKSILRLRGKLGLAKDARLYGCRHAFATGAILSGVGIATLAELMGHSSILTTQRYIHLSGKVSHLREAIEIAGRLRPTQPSPRNGAPSLPRADPHRLWQVAPNEPPVTANGSASVPEKLTPTQTRTWEAYSWAIENSPDLAKAKDKDVFEWLAKHPELRGQVPAKEETFTRYLRKARLFHDCRKRELPPRRQSH